MIMVMMLRDQSNKERIEWRHLLAQRVLANANELFPGNPWPHLLYCTFTVWQLTVTGDLPTPADTNAQNFPVDNEAVTHFVFACVCASDKAWLLTRWHANTTIAQRDAGGEQDANTRRPCRATLSFFSGIPSSLITLPYYCKYIN